MFGPFTRQATPWRDSLEGPACQVRCITFDNPFHLRGRDKHAPPNGHDRRAPPICLFALTYKSQSHTIHLDPLREAGSPSVRLSYLSWIGFNYNTAGEETQSFRKNLFVRQKGAALLEWWRFLCISL